ncbi:MAG: hypothetical protein LBC53_03225 [Spirochaetaceae bacterium]|jgi:hypothetical protein|nr:hypothetical protein [Spirochaetaceae bacterium]
MVYIIAILFVMTTTFTVSANDFLDAIRQQLDLTIHQSMNLYGIREDNPLNRNNWQEQEEWESRLEAELSWYLQFANILQLNFRGDMQWSEISGYYDDREFLYKDVLFNVDETLLDINIYGTGRIMAGKTMRKYGAALLLPVTNFLYEDTIEKDSENHGKWMAGFSFYQGIISVESWYSPIADWVHDAYTPPLRDGLNAIFLLNSIITTDIHRFGFVYYHNRAHKAGAYYSGQIGDSFIPYAEIAVSNHPLVSSFAPDAVLSRSDSWSFDGLLGGSCYLTDINTAIYMEYRYRTSGYTNNNWNVLEQGLSSTAIIETIANALPYLYTPVHTIGIRVQNTRQIRELFDYGINLFWLAPYGMYIRGEGVVSLFERLKISLGASYIPSFGNSGETRWWNKTWQIDLALQWSVRTME